MIYQILSIILTLSILVITIMAVLVLSSLCKYLRVKSLYYSALRYELSISHFPHQFR